LICDTILGLLLDEDPVAELFKFLISLRILGYLMLGNPNLKFCLLFSLGLMPS
jgi:hypothetical protein